MDSLLGRGIEEFNRQFFFEAHDLWEELWMETAGTHRVFYQGLIQTAVGFYHLDNGNYKGACSQFGKALAKLGQYLPDYAGINTARLVEAIRECLSEAELIRENGARGFSGTIPRIEMV